MEKLLTDAENADRPLHLENILKELQRPSPFAGMEGEKFEDPVAQEIITIGSESLNKIESFLKVNDVEELAPLGDGYGFSAVVLDGGKKVVRLSRIPPTKKPELLQILQPLAVACINGIWIQISKKLNTGGVTQDDVKKIEDDLIAQNYHWDDAGTDNLGIDEDGNVFILDGSVTEIPK